MKLAVVGNCQASGVAHCIHVMNPYIEATGIPYGTTSFDPGRFDQIVVQNSIVDDVRRYLTTHSAEAKLSLTWPTFFFPAFHPDLVYVFAGGAPVKTPLGDYSSSLAFHGWKAGLGVEMTERLFCEAVYRRLGFFDGWDVSKDALLQSAEAIGFDFDGDFQQWSKTGCFAHSFNHPKLHVLASFAGQIIAKVGSKVMVRHPDRFISDALALSSVWPVYPEVASRLGLPEGDYVFKAPRLDGDMFSANTFSLREFIEGSFAAYDGCPTQDLVCDRLDGLQDAYNSLASLVPTEPRRSSNPYRALADHHFWRKSVSEPAVADVDPVVRTRFKLNEADRIATAGSCFAQRIARTLIQHGYNYYDAEPAPAALDAEEAAQRGYGLFSARYGNIYTARQLRQLIERAYGRFRPADTAWRRADGRWIDPFRPQLEPGGFDSPEAVRRERDAHMAAVRTMFEHLDLFVFTIGLTEAWCAVGDDAVFPVAPGVVAADHAPDQYRFVNFTAAEVRTDLDLFVTALKAVNPGARVLLTVSPVPLIATFEDRHVLTSNTYSKSALRVAADELQRQWDDVEYFPSFEIITGAFNRASYFADDLREVRPEGVDHVMRLFQRYFFGAGPRLRQEIACASRVICDEVLLDT